MATSPINGDEQPSADYGNKGERDRQVRTNVRFGLTTEGTERLERARLAPVRDVREEKGTHPRLGHSRNICRCSYGNALSKRGSLRCEYRLNCRGVCLVECRFGKIDLGQCRRTYCYQREQR